MPISWPLLFRLAIRDRQAHGQVAFLYRRVGRVMRVRGSAVVPWLFFGPLFTAMTAGVVHAIFGGAVWAWIAQGATALTVSVAVAAFLAARRSRS